MNQAIYKMAADGGSIRLVVQKKPAGSFILGVSNGKDNPLICQGTPEEIEQQFTAQIDGYVEKIKATAIEAKLKAAETEMCEPEKPVPQVPPPPEPVIASQPVKENAQAELDFGF